MNRLVLVDGNAIMHRAYHALPPLTSPDGKLVHVVYGFVSMILRIFYDLKPTHIAVAFDRPGPTFRNLLYKEYQIQRPKMEDDFISQISLVHEMVTAFGLPIYELDGFEADDMIGTIVMQVNKKYPPLEAGKSESGKAIDQVIIVTGDRDILQLVQDERVLVFMPTKGLSEGRLYGEKEVIERMGVAPSLIVDLKALAGDSSDNYPGVAGIGPKTATQLLKEYGSVEGIYKNIVNVVGKTTKTKLVAGKESAMLGRNLATIRSDAPIVFAEETARVVTLDTPSARSALEAFHFPSLLKRLSGNVVGGKEKTKKQVKKIKEGIQSDQQQLF